MEICCTFRLSAVQLTLNLPIYTYNENSIQIFHFVRATIVFVKIFPKKSADFTLMYFHFLISPTLTNICVSPPGISLPWFTLCNWLMYRVTNKFWPMNSIGHKNLYKIKMSYGQVWYQWIAKFHFLYVHIDTGRFSFKKMAGGGSWGFFSPHPQEMFCSEHVEYVCL